MRSEITRSHSERTVLRDRPSKIEPKNRERAVTTATTVTTAMTKTVQDGVGVIAVEYHPDVLFAVVNRSCKEYSYNVGILQCSYYVQLHLQCCSLLSSLTTGTLRL
jgi:hypothetical protein